MTSPNEVRCLSCDGAMRPQIDRLDLGWVEPAGERPGGADGPYARDDDFAGILAEVYDCACGRVAIRPVRIELSRSRDAAAAA
jgi:hypothetical protein